MLKVTLPSSALLFEPITPAPSATMLASLSTVIELPLNPNTPPPTLLFSVPFWSVKEFPASTSSEKSAVEFKVFPPKSSVISESI